MMKWWHQLVCSYKGDDWLLGSAGNEFVPVTDVCTRCGKHRVILPWGDCIGLGVLDMHPIAQHYRVTEEIEGIMKVDIVAAGRCPVPL